ncbi:hypothetical protein SGPA1_11061 [Streptomyces misionensis JCM 4497]
MTHAESAVRPGADERRHRRRTRHTPADVVLPERGQHRRGPRRGGQPARHDLLLDRERRPVAAHHRRLPAHREPHPPGRPGVRQVRPEPAARTRARHLRTVRLRRPRPVRPRRVAAAAGRVRPASDGRRPHHRRLPGQPHHRGRRPHRGPRRGDRHHRRRRGARAAAVRAAPVRGLVHGHGRGPRGRAHGPGGRSRPCRPLNHCRRCWSPSRW